MGAVSGQQRYRLDNLARLHIKDKACRVSSGARLAQSGLCRGLGFAGQRQGLRCPRVQPVRPLWNTLCNCDAGQSGASGDSPQPPLKGTASLVAKGRTKLA